MRYLLQDSGIIAEEGERKNGRATAKGRVLCNSCLLD